MNKFLLSCILFNVHWMLIYAQPKYPVDISYLVADLKYSQEHGLKICEVQHGALSAFNGDLYISGQDGIISPIIADFFNLIPMKKWAVGLIYPPLKRSLVAKEWIVEQSFQTLEKDQTFLKYAKTPPVDPFCITAYKGIVYADFDVVKNFSMYYKTYPGILFMNAATFPYWKDKYKMSELFDCNDELKQYKADWRLYPKKYDSLLSATIQQDMPCEFYVIKPRGEVLANGVIVVANKDLDTILHMILEPLPNLQNHPDKKYSYWFKNKDNTFIIEKYYRSDYLSFSHPLDKETSDQAEYSYDPTMRIVFILQSDGEKLTYHYQGGFWKLPYKALQENGTLNETRISYGKPPFYHAIDLTLLQEVNIEMEKAMLYLYEIMLKEYSQFQTLPMK